MAGAAVTERYNATRDSVFAKADEAHRAEVATVDAASDVMELRKLCGVVLDMADATRIAAKSRAVRQDWLGGDRRFACHALEWSM